MKIYNQLWKYLILLVVMVGCTKIDEPVTTDVKVESNLDKSVVYYRSTGRTIGIWPTSDYWDDAAILRELRENYGFDAVCIYPLERLKNNAVSAGYILSTDVIFKIADNPGYNDHYENITSTFDPGEAPKAYYYDEPIEHATATRSELIAIWNTIDTYGFTAPYTEKIVGLYRYSHTEYSPDSIPNYADYLFYTTYDYRPNMLINPFTNDPIELDQRPGWDEMIDVFSSSSMSFSSVWINAHLDRAEFDNLLSEASDLGLSVWLYAKEDGTTVNDIKEFCEAAVRTGWMERW